MEGDLDMSELAKKYLNRIKRNMPVHKADDELLQAFLLYAKGTDIMEVIALLLNAILTLDSKLNVANMSLKERDEEIRLLNKEIELIKERVQLSAYEKNQCKMKAGRPIALKGKYSDVLKLELKGYTDKQIMQELGISKSTLWRYRKQAGGINK